MSFSYDLYYHLWIYFQLHIFACFYNNSASFNCNCFVFTDHSEKAVFYSALKKTYGLLSCTRQNSGADHGFVQKSAVSAGKCPRDTGRRQTVSKSQTWWSRSGHSYLQNIPGENNFYCNLDILYFSLSLFFFLRTQQELSCPENSVHTPAGFVTQEGIAGVHKHIKHVSAGVIAFDHSRIRVLHSVRFSPHCSCKGACQFDKIKWENKSSCSSFFL